MNLLASYDKEIYEAIRNERKRQQHKIEMIASENFVSEAVLAAMNNVMTNKYAEGYPGKRYYGGCENVDVAEEVARRRLKQIFSAEHVNVQPHSGSQANMAVYFSVLKPGDTVLGMDLSHGGHLTHGSSVNFSGDFYRFVSYGVDRHSQRIDYDDVLSKAKKHRPKLIVAGASAYPRSIDFAKFKDIADEVGALLMVDMAHIAGLVATGHHPSPVPHADFVTSTTHKTLRGPRGGFILCKEKFARAIDKAVFPGIQGGPLMHTIAAKAVAFKEVLQPEFKAYSQAVIENARQLAIALHERGLPLVSGGTDTHLLLVDLRPLGLTGKRAEQILDEVGITCNKNAVPFDTESPLITSGIRLGTAAVTTRGFDRTAMKEVAQIISLVLKNPADEKIRNEARESVSALSEKYPLYSDGRRPAEG